jgi:gas vesicle protein
MSLGLNAKLSGAGAVIGGVSGFMIAGQKGAVEGSKLGAATGNQIAQLAKKPGKDAVGRIVEDNTKTQNDALKQIAEVSSKAIEEFADKYSKVIILGSILQIVMSGTVSNLEIYNKFCPTIFENLACAPIMMTTISLQSTAAVGAFCLIKYMLKSL